jgi:hypothetical protein
MKTICITILIYFFSWGMSNGQTFKIQYGRDWSKLKWYKNDEYTNYTETLNGNIFYLGVDFLNKKYFNLNTNVGYLQKQGEKSYIVYDDKYNARTINGKTSFEQITLNTKFIIKYPIKGKFIPFLGISPSVDFLISNSNVDDRISIVESNMFGLLLGGGINYCISKFQIGLNVDYCKYFSYFAHLESRPDPGMTGFAPPEDVKSQTILSSISIGYRIK